MIVKFFKNKKGGSVKALDYLLNERVNEGTAKCLKGNPQLTRDIIKSIERKQKVTVGVLSFEEKEPLTEKEKHEIIESFEEMLLAGLSKDQYNILWVEHVDKGRLELNFVIPKTELSTGKALQPYFHKADMKRKELWQELMNIKYNLTSPADPKKERNLEGSYKAINLIKNYLELDKTLKQLVEQEQIHNREEIINLLKESGIEVTRAGKNYISVKLPNSKKAKRLKGGIYDERFKSLTKLKEIGEEKELRIREYKQRNDEEVFKQIREKLDELIRQKAEQNRRKYIRKVRKQTGQQKRNNPINTNISFNNVGNIQYPSPETANKQSGVDNTKNNENNKRKREIYSGTNRENSSTRQELHIYKAEGGKINGEENSNRRDTIEEIKRAREIEQRAAKNLAVLETKIREQLRKNREGLQTEHKEHAGGLFEKAKEAIRRRRERVKERIAGIGEKIREFFRNPAGTELQDKGLLLEQQQKQQQPVQEKKKKKRNIHINLS